MIGANQYVLTWEHFGQLHEDKRTSFENLCRSLFQRKFCKEGTILHSEPNHPGVEVTPVLSKDGTKRISFQAKYFDDRIGYSKIKDSAQEAISHYKGELEQIYLYCNKDSITNEIVVPWYIGEKDYDTNIPIVELRKSNRSYSLENFMSKVIIIPEYVKIIEKGVFDGLDGVTIKTSYENKPEGWDDGWNSNCEVEWGYSI